MSEENPIKDKWGKLPTLENYMPDYISEMIDDICSLEEERDKLQTQVKDLAEALQFYAQDWSKEVGGATGYHLDKGQHARQVLKKHGLEE